MTYSGLPSDSDNKQQLSLRADIEPTLHPGLALKLNQLLVLQANPALSTFPKDELTAENVIRSTYTNGSIKQKETFQ